MQIVFENADFVVCVKPQGVLSAADASGKPSMASLLAPRTVWPVHRLDREAGGLMVFAKSAQCAAKFSAAAQSGAIYKEYLAVCEGTPPQEGTWEDLLYHDRIKNKTYVVRRARGSEKGEAVLPCSARAGRRLRGRGAAVHRADASDPGAVCLARVSALR